MSKSRKSKKTRVAILPENYIRKRSRNIPVEKCIINKDWRKYGRANIIVTRRHPNGNVSFCGYLVDKCCLGVKDTLFVYNMPQNEFDDYLAECHYMYTLEEVSYDLVHNIIFAAAEYAEDYGFKPHKNFTSITKHFLEEDDENVPFIDIRCGGAKGRPLYFNDGDETPAQAEKIIQQLKKTAGEGNFDVGPSMEMPDIRTPDEMKRNEKEEKKFYEDYSKKLAKASARTLDKETSSVFTLYLNNRRDEIGSDAETMRKAEILAEFWRERDGMCDRYTQNEYLKQMNEIFAPVKTERTDNVPNSLFPTFSIGGEGLEYDFMRAFLMISVSGNHAENAEKQIGKFERNSGECGASVYLKSLFNRQFHINAYPDMERQLDRFKDYFLIKMQRTAEQLISANRNEMRTQLLSLVEGKTITKFEYLQFIMCYMDNVFDYMNNETEHLIEKILALIAFLENYHRIHADFPSKSLIAAAKTRLLEATIIRVVIKRYPPPPPKQPKQPKKGRRR